MSWSMVILSLVNKGISSIPLVKSRNSTGGKQIKVTCKLKPRKTHHYKRNRDTQLQQQK